MEKRYVGTQNKIDAALYKITELKSLGYSEDQISAVANTDDDFAQLRRQTFVSLDGQGKEGFLDRFKGTFLDNRPKQAKYFEDMGFSREEAENIYNEMKHGGIAIFVDNVEPDITREGRGGGEVEDTEREIRASMVDRTTMLPADDILKPRDEYGDSVPRINTDNL
ncbi:general stress protein [Sporosarcina sp. FSL W8-0480]|uniref:general stress protein n=1 Tax=Sporosarcina sp. FSL W8-0480 TaxID=2954701 RepID=UPI0030DD1343